MSSVRMPSNSSTHHISPLHLPEVGDPGPSTQEHSLNFTLSDDLAPEPGYTFMTESQAGILGTPSGAPRCPAVELEEVPDIDEWDASSNSDAAGLEFELNGILLDDSQFDSDEDDDEGWIKQVSAKEQLNDRFYAEAVKQVQIVTEEDMDCFEAFNYKVDTNLGDNAYLKLPRGFRHLRDSISSIDILQRRVTQLSGVCPHQYDCCINSSCCYTRQYAKLQSCPYCWEPRYTRRKKPMKTFNYLPFIPRLKQWFCNPELVEKLLYCCMFKTSPPKPDNPGSEWDNIIDIFDGEIYLSLLEERVIIGDEKLGHRFFSDR
ncbi:hypothetical protein FRC01_002184 [Tulasnella sp. 417]|nr:hypothetical protein FRC01_002184 [Tulasnella sp. 417]